MERRISSKLFYKDNKPLKFCLPNEPQAIFFKQRILEGGGQVTDSENADIIIHGKTISSNYPNVYSENIIVDSYFYNELQELNKYKIIIPNSSQKESIKKVEMLRPKKARIEYTKEDDNLLASFIKDCLYPKGRKIYIEMEEKYPHHSWQSWRERYIKVVGPALESGNWPTYYFGDKYEFEGRHTNRNLTTVNNNENNISHNNNTNIENDNINEDIIEDFNNRNNINYSNVNEKINGNSNMNIRKVPLNFVKSNINKKGKTIVSSDSEDSGNHNSGHVEIVVNRKSVYSKNRNDNDSDDNGSDYKSRKYETDDSNNFNNDNIFIDESVDDNDNFIIKSKGLDDETKTEIRYSHRNKRSSSKDRRKLFYNNMDSDNDISEDNTIPNIIQERRLYTKKKRSYNKVDSNKVKTKSKKEKSIVLPKSLLSLSSNINKVNYENDTDEDERINDESDDNLSRNKQHINERNNDEIEKNLVRNKDDGIAIKNIDIQNDGGSELINENDFSKLYNKNGEINDENDSITKNRHDQNINKSSSRIDNINDNSETQISDDDNELQSYLNNYFSEKNIQKYKMSDKKNKSNDINSKESASTSYDNNTNDNMSIFNSQTNTSKTSNDNSEKISNLNVPFVFSSKFLNKNISSITDEGRNNSVNNLKNLIKKIDSNQRLNQKSLRKEMEKDASLNISHINSYNNQKIPININENFGNNNFSKPTKESIYFSYTNFFENDMDMEIPLSYSSVDYDNFLSKNIENSKNSIHLPKVSTRHKNIYIKQCLLLCKETHVSKQELCNLLHQCNGSLPATKALIKSKHNGSDEIIDSKLREWIWSKEEDDILLKSKDESQLKRIRLMKGNKSVRYRELYLEAKEIFQKLKNAETSTY